jgi:hypothetical protein
VDDFGSAQSDFWLAQSWQPTRLTVRRLISGWEDAAGQGDDSTALANFQQTAALDPTGF